MAGQEIQRLNMVLKEKTTELSQYEIRFRQSDTEEQRKQAMIKEMQTSIGNLEININQRDERIRVLERENGQLRENSKSVQVYEQKIETISF